MTLADMMHALRKRQTPGILNVAAIDDKAQRAHLAPRFLLEFDTPHRFQINGRHLLAGAQVGDCRLACRGGNPEGDTAAHSAPVEPQHPPGQIRGAQMQGANTTRASRSRRPRGLPGYACRAIPSPSYVPQGPTGREPDT